MRADENEDILLALSQRTDMENAPVEICCDDKPSMQSCADIFLGFVKWARNRNFSRRDIIRLIKSADRNIANLEREKNEKGN